MNEASLLETSEISSQAIMVLYLEFCQSCILQMWQSMVQNAPAMQRTKLSQSSRVRNQQRRTPSINIKISIHDYFSTSHPDEEHNNSETTRSNPHKSLSLWHCCLPPHQPSLLQASQNHNVHIFGDLYIHYHECIMKVRYCDGYFTSRISPTSSIESGDISEGDCSYLKK